MLDARNASVCGKRRFPFERGFAGKCWRVPLVASNANGKHDTMRACVVTCLCFRLCSPAWERRLTSGKTGGKIRQ